MSKEKRLIFVILAALLGLMIVIASCDNGKWEIAMRYPFLHHPEDILFKGDIGLFFGHYRSQENILERGLYKRLSSREAIILREGYSKLKQYGFFI